MRTILGIALVLAGAVFINVAAPGKIAETYATKNRVVIDGLHVALPKNMKNLPVELVPLP
jgi:hypothetical protein